MKRDDFKDYLTTNGIRWKEEDNGKIVIDGGDVYLNSLTTLPDNVQFNNGGDVYLDSLTTLPDNVQFNNGGSVYLDSLKTLPDNVQFNNGGNVDLRSLTTLPDNVQFNNGGYVYLDSLKTLPENVQFNNGGYVYLDSLSKPNQFYQGKNRTFKVIDGYTMLIESFKRRGEVTISKARYFGGGPIEKLKQCFIAELGGHSAHGDTAQEAVRDLNFKVLQETANLSEIVEQVKSSGKVTVAQYRLLTGACAAGVEHFLELKGISPDTESLPLKEVIAMTEGAFGGEKMKNLFA